MTVKNRLLLPRWGYISLFAFCTVQLTATPQAIGTPQQGAQRPVTVADSIGMARSEDWSLARFSPDGNKFVVVVKRGNLEDNTTDYSLLIWKTESVFNSPEPYVALTMASSSNRDAIEDPTWLSDNKSVAFLGEHSGETHQLYLFDTVALTLKKATSHPTNLLAYSVTPQGDKIAYAAETAYSSIWDDKARREGVLVSNELLLDLLQGRTGGRGYSAGYPLFICSPGGVGHLLKTREEIRDYIGSKPLLSPDGRYIIIATQVAKIPISWKGYQDPIIQRLADVKLLPGQTTFLKRFELVDTVTGESRFLLDAPLGKSGSDVTWSPDSHSVVITRAFLPLDNIQGEERKARAMESFTFQVNISSGDITKISNEDLYGAKWDARNDCVSSHVMRLESNTEFGLGEPVFFRKNGTNWDRVEPSGCQDPRPEIVLEEGVNNPPKIFARDPTMRRTTLLLDLNPQFVDLRFAKVEEVYWNGIDGRKISGGLYYPVHYEADKKYPLVIQTHGWTPKKFMIDGPYTTGYGAQALTSHDIVVLQADDSTMSTFDEAPGQVASYEGVIEFLDHKGLIDRDRVGIMGFSRSCLYVTYALTHSKYHFAAASIIDGYDGGYFAYNAFSNVYPFVADDLERVNGGHPWGEGLRSWLEKSPGFNVDKVHSPLRIMASNPGSLLQEWEWFALLRRMGKPVELIYLQDGRHELVRPWDRAVSQQGNVDWFCFWLRGEEDPDLAKAAQYTRWREMRKMQYEGNRQ